MDRKSTFVFFGGVFFDPNNLARMHPFRKLILRGELWRHPSKFITVFPKVLLNPRGTYQKTPRIKTEIPGKTLFEDVFCTFYKSSKAVTWHIFPSNPSCLEVTWGSDIFRCKGLRVASVTHLQKWKFDGTVVPLSRKRRNRKNWSFNRPCCEKKSRWKGGEEKNEASNSHSQS